MNRPLVFFMVLLLALVCAGCSVNPSELPFEKLTARIMGLKLHDREPYEVTDPGAVDLFKSCLSSAKQVEETGVELSRNPTRVTLRIGDKRMTERLEFHRFGAGNPSYVTWRGKWYEVSDFTDLASAVQYYRAETFDTDPEDEAFLARFGWSPFFLVSEIEVELPGELVHRPGEFPVVIYWALNNELSKDAGFDLSPHFGKTVQVRLYKTVELLPEFMGPNRYDGKAVVVRSGGEIVGAWLTVSRHDVSSCSLTGRSFEEVTGKPFEEWVTFLIDPNDPLEKELSAMSPEEVIRTYYDAIDRKDYTLAHACESRSLLFRYLGWNMDSTRLYDDGFPDKEGDGLSNFLSIKVRDVKLAEEAGAVLRGEPNLYYASVEQHRKVLAGGPDGLSGYFIRMRQETPETGWRIDSIGTGP